ncbi:hypothetical protein Q3G72_021654 [Acer saccharum]|nr:hypothetical protein Q3G72_021654 [Acer saccharum]
MVSLSLTLHFLLELLFSHLFLSSSHFDQGLRIRHTRNFKNEEDFREESGGFIGGGFWCSRTGLSTCYSVSFISRNEGAYHPIELAKLKNLTQFRINDNNFNGRIPDFIQNWKGLRGLKIRGSGLKGPIPSSISVLKITRTIED